MDKAIDLASCLSATQALGERTGAGPSLPASVAFVCVDHGFTLA